MPSYQVSLCHSFLFLPSVFPSIRVFSEEPALRISTTGVQQFCVVWTCPAPCGIFSSISGLYSVDASNTCPAPQMDTKRISSTARCLLATNAPHWGTTLLKELPAMCHWVKGQKPVLAAAESSCQRRGDLTAQPPHVMEVGIMSASKFVFMLEHFINMR